jgi:HEAT repeat protein
VNNPDEEIRITAAIALGMIPTYDSGTALISLLRDKSPMVRATACESAAAIHAKNCEEYVKKLAFTETDPHVKMVARKAFDRLKDSVLLSA